ncbi:hypothetical protein C8F04DRAFT_1137197, partial [Mycena alexandri]
GLREGEAFGSAGGSSPPTGLMRSRVPVLETMTGVSAGAIAESPPSAEPPFEVNAGSISASPSASSSAAASRKFWVNDVCARGLTGLGRNAPEFVSVGDAPSASATKPGCASSSMMRSSKMFRSSRILTFRSPERWSSVLVSLCFSSSSKNLRLSFLYFSWISCDDSLALGGGVSVEPEDEAGATADATVTSCASLSCSDMDSGQGKRGSEGRR